MAFAGLAFPPDSEAAWLYPAYRHYLGLQPFPAVQRPDWTWPDQWPQPSRHRTVREVGTVTLMEARRSVSG
ncbi:MAG: hypothetical protein JO362_06075 [Streptomycetaceae bacterium]|nr:hypothetical protein [Streptomycetaceae bacterium]